jgi:hypothetical protein
MPSPQVHTATAASQYLPLGVDNAWDFEDWRDNFRYGRVFVYDPAMMVCSCYDGVWFVLRKFVHELGTPMHHTALTHHGTAHPPWRAAAFEGHTVKSCGAPSGKRACAAVMTPCSLAHTPLLLLRQQTLA